MTFPEFMQWAFLGGISGLVVIGWQVKNSVQELSIRIAVVIERLDGHEKRILKLEDNGPIRNS